MLVDKHYRPTTSSVSNNTLLLCSYSTSAGSSSYYEANLVDTREIDGTDFVNQTAIKLAPSPLWKSDLHVKIGILRLGEGGRGLTNEGTSFNTLYFDINNIELHDVNGKGIYTGTSDTFGAQYIGKIGKILSVSGIGDTGIFIVTTANAHVNVDCNEIQTNGYSYKILDAFSGDPDSGNLYINCNNIRSGDRQGTPAYENSNLFPLVPLSS